MRSGNLPLQKHDEAGLAQFSLLPMTEEILMRAAELRARFKLKTPDALHLAGAQCHHCEALWTNDGRLAQASPGLAVDVLQQAVA